MNYIRVFAWLRDCDSPPVTAYLGETLPMHCCNHSHTSTRTYQFCYKSEAYYCTIPINPHIGLIHTTILPICCTRVGTLAISVPRYLPIIVRAAWASSFVLISSTITTSGLWLMDKTWVFQWIYLPSMLLVYVCLHVQHHAVNCMYVYAHDSSVSTCMWMSICASCIPLQTWK